MRVPRLHPSPSPALSTNQVREVGRRDKKGQTCGSVPVGSTNIENFCRSVVSAFSRTNETISDRASSSRC